MVKITNKTSNNSKIRWEYEIDKRTNTNNKRKRPSNKK